MAGIFDGANIDLGGFTTGLLPKLWIYAQFLGIFIFALALISILYISLNRNKKFKINIEVYEKINGKYTPVRNLKARLIFINGSPFFYIKALRKKIPRGTKKTGNKYIYCISKDGTWINVDFEDLDEKARKLKINLDNAQVSLAVSASRKLLKEDYTELNPLLKYLPVLAMAGLIMIFGIVMMLIMREYNTASTGIASAVSTAKELQEVNKDILVSIDNILNNGKFTRSG